MKTCPRCKASLSDEYRYCLNCGSDLEHSPERAEEEPLPTLVYQGPIATPANEATTNASDVPPTMPSNLATMSKTSRSSWLPWILVLACTVTIVALIAIIAFQKRSSTPENLSLLAPPEPTPTVMASELASNSNSNQPTPRSSVSPSEKKQATPKPTPDLSTNIVDDPSAIPSATPTPSLSTPTPMPTPSPALDNNRVYSNREVSEPARIASQPKPAYTDSARQNQIAGVVVLRVVLGFDATVRNISVVSGLPYGLTERAIAAARNIKFTPARKDGTPVSVAIQVEYVFNLY